MSYQPRPIDTSKIPLPEDLLDLTEQLAEHIHDVWAQRRISEGWVYGSSRDDQKKEHPCLVPYSKLPESEKDYDRATAVESIKAIIALGYSISS